MKVYASPIKFEHDFRDYDTNRENERVETHKKQLKEWLISNGYNGKHTGKIVSFGVADGCAQYMLADGKKSFLIHLPYWDAWQYQDVQFLPKKEILRRAEQYDRLGDIFSGGKI